MLRSLLEANQHSFIHVLAMDEYTFDILNKSPFRSKLSLISLCDIENYEIELNRLKTERTRAEYCWTLTPVIMKYVLDSDMLIKRLTYLDADLLFFSDYLPIIDEINGKSIAVIEHRYAEPLSYMIDAGRFNVEWVTFNRDKEAFSCLSRWYTQCLEWCSAVAADGKFGDQRYLDEWPVLYSNLGIIQHAGAGVAPWNYSNYEIEDLNSVVTVSGAPLIFYHFHQYKITKRQFVFYMSRAYSRQGVIPVTIYKIYDSAIQNAIVDIKSLDNYFAFGFESFSILWVRRFVQGYFSPRIKEFLKNRLRFLYNRL